MHMRGLRPGRANGEYPPLLHAATLTHHPLLHAATLTHRPLLHAANSYTTPASYIHPLTFNTTRFLHIPTDL